MKKIKNLLQDYKIELTCLDLGASGGSYTPFQRVKDFSHIIEVDPDNREFNSRSDKHTTIIPAAVAADNKADSILLHLTKSPYCSSSLLPNMERLQNFSYAEKFEVLKTIKVPATSLDSIVKETGKKLNWIKLDTQGTELGILKSLGDENWPELLCCDIEASLYEHYHGACTLPELHEFMLSKGFAISTIKNQERIRMTPQQFGQLYNIGISYKALSKWPTSSEIRYIRSIDHSATISDIANAIKLWTISYHNHDYSYCFFLADKLSSSNEENQKLANYLKEMTIKRFSNPISRLLLKSLRQLKAPKN